MKTAILFLILFATLSAPVSAQRKIQVKESNEKMAGGNHNSLIVTIYESDPDKIEKAWKKLMKDYNAKVSNKDEIFADDATMADVSANTVDVYAKVNKISEDECELVVCVDMGGAYLESGTHSGGFRAMKSVMYNFAVETTKEAIQEKQKDAEKELEKMERDKVELIKENERLVKLIDDCKAKITKAEQDIVTNNKSQEDKSAEIELQKKKVEEISAREKAVE
jgi:hypothetical protein